MIISALPISIFENDTDLYIIKRGMLEKITNPFHNEHPWFKLLSKSHYDELWLPDIFPSELQRKIQFIRTPSNMNDHGYPPVYFNMLDDTSYIIITCMHPKLLRGNLVEKVRNAQDIETDQRPKSDIKLKPNIIKELPDNFKKCFVKNGCLEFPLLFEFVQTYVVKAIQDSKINYMAYSRYADIQVVLQSMKEFSAMPNVKFIAHVDLKNFHDHFYMPWVILGSSSTSKNLKTVPPFGLLISRRGY